MNVTPSLLLVLLLGLASGCGKSPTEVSTAGNTPEGGVCATGCSSSAQVIGSEGMAITPEAAQKAGIELAEVGPAQIRETLTLYGSIKPNAEREQDIRARYPGVVRSVNYRAGDTVGQGRELLTVESNESLQVYAIRSPLSGQVLERRTNPGDAVDNSTVLMNVADLSTVWAEFAIFARDLSHVRPGMRVLFRGTDADETVAATINYVAPTGHADSQSVVARALVSNRNGRWVPGQFITGDVVIADVKVSVAVKPTALQELQGKTMVFVQTGRGFAPRPVQVGKRSREAVEIAQGLNAGERYASTNSYLIKADLLKSEVEED
jgi:cobalt-zinc-cadmium efflux system membrane fusion protein